MTYFIGSSTLDSIGLRICSYLLFLFYSFYFSIITPSCVVCSAAGSVLCTQATMHQRGRGGGQDRADSAAGRVCSQYVSVCLHSQLSTLVQMHPKVKHFSSSGSTFIQWFVYTHQWINELLCFFKLFYSFNSFIFCCEFVSSRSHRSDESSCRNRICPERRSKISSEKKKFPVIQESLPLAESLWQLIWS